MIETIHQYTWICFFGVLVLIIQHTQAAYCTELKKSVRERGREQTLTSNIHKGHSLPGPQIEQFGGKIEKQICSLFCV